ncbi:MAG: PIN domain nuclease [Deltaproteobacteria bacterium]|nr:PIN domain nuclease [Deltaproteobacteria bacterium]
MILVDTSVLINYFKGINNYKTEKLEEILKNGIIFGINNFIYQEILQGASTEKEFKLLNQYLSSQKFYELNYGTKSYENAAKIYYSCRKKGVTPRSTIDLLIVETAIENNLFLLHDDNDFTEIAFIVGKLKEYK